MQDQQLFEYAVIRIVPRVEREEFINAGIILFCKKLDFLHVLYELNEQKIAAVDAGCDVEELSTHLKAFESIATGDISAGPIAQLSPPERFRWLTAQRSTIIQTSKVHPGLGKDLMTITKQLFQQFVL